MYTTISDTAVAAVKATNAIKGAVYGDLMKRFNLKTKDTPRAWFNEKHYALTTVDAIGIICAHTGLSYADVIIQREGLPS